MTTNQSKEATEFCWLVELFKPEGNSMGYYHTGFTDLSGQSRTTKNPHEARRYTKAHAEAIAAKLHHLAGVWKAVEHGFHQSKEEGSFSGGCLTPTMQAAVRHAEAHGGLVRQPGGSWVAPKDADDWSWGRVRFGGSTVNGLVKRGLLAFTEHKDGRNGRFPIRAALSSQSANESPCSAWTGGACAWPDCLCAKREGADALSSQSEAR